MAIEIIDGFDVGSNSPIDKKRRIMDTIDLRNSIKENIRYDGLKTYVRATRTEYQLQGGITNAHWVPLKSSAIPDFAYNSLDEMRLADVSQIGDSAVDVWLYPTNQIFEWDAFSTAPDNNTTVIKPSMLTDEQAGRFVFKTELAAKNHNHEIEHVNGLTDELANKAPLVHAHDLNPAQFGNGVQVVNGVAELGGEITKEIVIKTNLDSPFKGGFTNYQYPQILKYNHITNKLIAIGNITNYRGVQVNGMVVVDRETGDIDPSFSDVYRPTDVVVLNDGSLVPFSTNVSSNFKYKGVFYGQIFKISKDGVASQGYSTSGGFIRNIVKDNDGKLLVFGDFTTYNGSPCPNLIRLNEDLTLDTTFNVGSGYSGGIVFDVAQLSDSSYITVGGFTGVNGHDYVGVAKLFNDGSVDTSFLNICDQRKIYFVAIPDVATSTIVLVGNFNQYAGKQCGGFVFIKPNGENYNYANGLYKFEDPSLINGIYKNGNEILIYGSFSTFNNSNCFYSLSLIFQQPQSYNPSGLYNFIPQSNPLVRSIVSLIKVEDFVYISQDNSYAGFEDYYGLIRFIHRNSSFNLSTQSILFHGAVGYDKKLFENGVFISYLQREDHLFITERYAKQNYLKQVELTTQTRDKNLCLRNNSFIEIPLAKSSNGLRTHSNCHRLGGTLERVTKLKSKDVSPFENGFTSKTSSVHHIYDSGESLFVFSTGTFNGYLESPGVIKTNYDGEVDYDFTPNFKLSVNSKVKKAFAYGVDKIIFAGEFGWIRNGDYKFFNANILCINKTTGVIDEETQLKFGTGFDRGVFDIDFLSEGRIVFVGYFTKFNGVKTPNGMVVLNSDFTINDEFKVNVGKGLSSADIRDVLVDSKNRIVIVGYFYNFNGVSRKGILRLHSNGLEDTSFVVGTGFTSTLPNKIIETSDNKYIIAGRFSSYNGVSCKGVVKLNENGSVDTTFTSVLTSYGNNALLELIGDRIYLSPTGSNFIALTQTGSVDTNFTTVCTSCIISGVKAINGKLLIYGTVNDVLNSKINGYAWGGLTYLNDNGSCVLIKSGIVGSGYPFRYDDDFSMYLDEDDTLIPDVRYIKKIILGLTGQIEELQQRIDNLSQSLTDEASAIRNEMTTADNTLQSNIDTVQSNVDAFSQTVTDELNSMRQEMTTADNTLQSNIDTVQSNVDAVSQSLTDEASAIRSEMTTADNTLQSNIDTVQSNVDASVSDINSSISQHYLERTMADANLQNQINHYAENITAVSQSLTDEASAIRSEMTTADTAMQGDISQLRTDVDELKAGNPPV